MKFARKPITVAVALTLPSLWQGAIAQESSATPVMGEVVVRASKIDDKEPFGASRLDAVTIAPYRAATSDTAGLVDRLPGVSLYGAGGVSSLPVIRGLADDRIRIKVDGMDLISSCANHMNPPLSHINRPTSAGSCCSPASRRSASAATASPVRFSSTRRHRSSPKQARAPCSRVRPAPSIAATAMAGEQTCRQCWPTKCST